jgi:hypothetical protein
LICVYFLKKSCTNRITNADECRRADLGVAATTCTNKAVNFLLSDLDLVEQKQFIARVHTRDKTSSILALTLKVMFPTVQCWDVNC